MYTSIGAPPPPPGRPSEQKRFRVSVWVIVVIAVLVVVSVGVTVHQIVASGITKGPDAVFGDQHLKTSVALIELHKLRYGRYPDKLSDLKFTGQWDQIALQSVGYYPNAERSAYYIEVERGWAGKPALEMPDEFWRGTGYSSSLKPKN